MVPRVAVVGCGPCGMSIFSAFDEAKQQGENVPKLTCFEKQAEPGGLWNFTWRTGLDEYGEPVHGSMYKYLWSNGPRECSEMANYSFEKHFNKSIGSFPPRIVLREYLVGRFNNIKDKDIRYNTVVRNVEQKEETFLVTVENLTSNQRYSEIFDYVVVATGHFSIPNLPTYPGLDKFSGRILHSHDFRNADEFKSKTVLLVGSSYSAEDIALQCHKYGAKKCIVSCRNNPMNFKWPEGIIELPGILKFDHNQCFFVDGSNHKIDDVIFCTGYKHHYPFMENKLKLMNATNILFINHLYKGIFLENNPRVMYVGMQDQYYTFTMFDIQAWYIRDCILGKIKLPKSDEMKAETKTWYDRCLELKSVYEEIDFQRDYINDLLEV